MKDRDFFISVAMATYNGETFIKEQITSILNNLGEKDELIISDDGSTDQTISIIHSFKDKRIRLIKGPQNGVKQNFANAIANCKGEYIFLSDQDDLWQKEKVKKVLEIFRKEKCDCVTHNCEVVNGDNSKVIIDSFFAYRKSKPGVIRNIYKNKYLGCCMAFHKNMIKYILPIPNTIEMHDQWIGIVCDRYGKSIFLEDKLIKYRRHDKNVSEMHHYPLVKMIKNRIVLIIEFYKRIKK